MRSCKVLATRGVEGEPEELLMTSSSIDICIGFIIGYMARPNTGEFEILMVRNEDDGLLAVADAEGCAIHVLKKDAPGVH